MTDSYPDAAAQQRNLTDYLRVLRRRKWVIVFTTVLVALLTVGFSLREQKAYQASAQVLINRQDLASTVTGTPQDPTLSEDPGRYAATQASVARSPTVAEMAIKQAKVNGISAGGLLAESSVTPNPNADLLLFTVNDANPLAAAQLVNAYAAAYANYKLALDTASLTQARDQLIAQMATLRANRATGTAQYANLADSEQRLHTMQLLQAKDIVLGNPTSGVQVKPTPKRDGLLGFGFGLVLGVGLAFMLEALDRRVRSEDEVERELELPLLARLPEPPRRLRERFGLTMIHDPTSAHADASRRLATAVGFANPDHPPRVVIVTSCMQREGKSTTVANLAVALARSGHKVALIDLDLRQPTLASLFGIHQLTGLTDVAVRTTALDDALVPVEPAQTDPRLAPGGRLEDLEGSLEVLPSGPLPASPGEFIASEALAERVLSPLRRRFDYVLIDTPPMCVVGDALTLSARVDAVILVTRLGLVSRAALQDVKRQLAATPAAKLGFVATGAATTAAYGYGGYYEADPAANGDGSSTKSDRVGRRRRQAQR